MKLADLMPAVTGTGPGPARGAGLVAVVGACGGAGTSVLAAAMTRALRRRGKAATAVDLDTPGGGLDVLLGIETTPGARWGDLADARGAVDGADLLAVLPRWGAVPVLSGSRGHPVAPAPAVVLDVTTALLRAGECVVLDLPRPGGWGEACRALVSAADVVVLTVPLTVAGVAGAVAASDLLSAAGAREVRVAARGPAPGRVDAGGLAAALGRDVDVVVGWDARLAGAVERGEGPAATRRSPLARAAVDLAGLLGRAAPTPSSGSGTATGSRPAGATS
jgi:secretion/DNA translocation related CpaE-like protein